MNLDKDKTQSEETQQPSVNNEIDLNDYRPRASEMSKNKSGFEVSKIIRYFFGVFMMLFYIAMGIVLIGNYLNLPENDYSWTRYLVGVILIVYGVWRGYRQFTGRDYYSNYQNRER